MPATLANSTKTYTLNNGLTIPAVGLGTWQLREGEAYAAVVAAIKAGYRHIDTAWIYGNEVEVGRGIKDALEATGLKREDIYVTTKVWNTFHQDPLKNIDISLEKLGLAYVDLVLIHWPVLFDATAPGAELGFPKNAEGLPVVLLDSDLVATYARLQEAVKAGKTKLIGVLNVLETRLRELLAAPTTTIKPAVNQIEAHPYLTQPGLLAYAKEQGILIEAYSPLGLTLAPLLQEPVVVAIAEKNGVLPAQVVLLWALWRGTVVLPKLVSSARIEANLQVFDLSNEDGEALNKLGEEKKHRYVDPNWGVTIYN